MDTENKSVIDFMPVFTLEEIIASPNLAENMTDAQRDKLGQWAAEGYHNDKESRAEWEDRNAEALKMALQVVDLKSEPWDGCANVRFPLISIASMHYSARAYPLLVNGSGVVDVQVYGPDPDGTRNERAMRIKKHMNWQMLEQMSEWEEEMDKALLIQSILGVAIKKIWFDTSLRRVRTQCISPAQLVVNYYAKGCIDDHERASYYWPCSNNECYTNVAQGLWCNYGEIDDDGEGLEYVEEELGEMVPGKEPATDAFTAEAERRTGQTAPMLDSTTPTTMVEQLCWIDFDDDGYAEPYFVTFEEETEKVRRIVARFLTSDVKKNAKGQVIQITPQRYYVAYPLIPSPDSSWYPIGMGRLLGSLDATASAAFNQLLDAGTLANYGGGWVGRGARFRGGQMQIKPGQFQPVDSVGGDLKNNIVPYPLPQPSAVLFQLLQYIIEYAERLVSANDIQMGENVGQNTPAQTAATMDENGGRVFAGMFKRTWRALREEERIILDNNQKFFKADEAFTMLTQSVSGMVQPDDYLKITTSDIRPVADPNIVSDTTRQNQAHMVLGLATSMPNFNMYQTIRRVLEAYKVPSIDLVFNPLPPGKPDIQPPPSIQAQELQVKQGQLQVAQQKAKNDQMKVQGTLSQAQQQLKMDMLKVQGLLGLQGAQGMNQQAQAILAIAQSKEMEQGKMIALIDAEIGAQKHHMDQASAIMDNMVKHVGMVNDTISTLSDAQQGMNDGSSGESDSATGGAPGGAGGMAPTPGNAPALSGTQGKVPGVAPGLGVGPVT